MPPRANVPMTPLMTPPTIAPILLLVLESTVVLAEPVVDEERLSTSVLALVVIVWLAEVVVDNIPL